MTTGRSGCGEPFPEHALPDLGAAAERTSLAWQRSGLGMIGVGALFTRAHTLLSLLTGSVLIGAGVLAAVLVGPWRYQAILARIRVGKSPSSRWALLLATVVICVSAGAGIGVVAAALLLPPSSRGLSW
ncbi:MAG: YidH family protein [Pseudonocardiaceae bacterium]